jgi:hypothetical protein
MNTSITLRIPVELRDALEEIWATEGKNMSGVIRDALKRLVTVHEFEELRKKTLRTKPSS